MSDDDSNSSSSGSSTDKQEKKKATATAKSASAITATRKKAASSSSSSSSESSSESESDEQAKKLEQAVKPKSKYVHTDSESEEEDAATRSRSMMNAQDKALDQISKASRDLRLSLSSDDWPKTKDLFESLNKLLAKHSKALKGITPEPYLEAMVALDTEVNAISEDKEAQKKLSQARYKAFSAVKSKLVKHLDPYRAEMAALPKKKPEEAKVEEPAQDEDDKSSTESEASSSSSSSESDSSSSDSDDDDGSSSGSSSSSSADFESDSESSSSSEEEEDRARLTGRDKWVKRAALKINRPAKPSTTGKLQEIEEKRRLKMQAAEKGRIAKIEEERQRKAREAAVVLTTHDVDRLIRATTAKLWKREANRREMIEMLRGHVSRATPFGPRHVLPGLMILVSSQFETRTIDDCMSLDRWRNAVSDLNYILRILAANPELRLVRMAVDESLDASTSANSETVEQILAEATRASQGDTQTIQAREKAQAIVSEVEAKRRAENPDAVFVMGDIFSFANRLATELYKALRITPPHTSEFLERLQDEAVMLDLAVSVQEYLERTEDFFGASKLALLRIELMYYKHDSIALPSHASRVRQNVLGNAYHPGASNVSWAGADAAFLDTSDVQKCCPAAWPVQVIIPELDTAELIEQLCNFIYREGEDSAKNRAMLCQMYHHALHDRFHKARDLLLMSHLQDNILNADVESQILFNRVMAQIGLCAFRNGLMPQAQQCLQEICGHGRAKELLAQGISWRKQHERDPERENLERRRLVPYHMHLDLDLLECCHLTSAMLLEVTNLALQDNKGAMLDHRGQQDTVVSKAFRKYLDAYERAVFTGPPENIRDHIMASAVAMREGDWKAASEHVLSLSVWDAVPNSFAIKSMLQSRIKGEALRVYLLTFAAYYESMRFDALCKLFEMDRAGVKAILAKLILGRSLQASWDDEVVRLHKLVPTNLQALCVQFADKSRELVESNEKLNDRLGSGSSEKRDDSGRGNWNKRGGGGGGGGDRNQRGGGDQRRRGGDRNNQGSHLVQRGYRSDRSRAGAGGPGSGNQW